MLEHLQIRGLATIEAVDIEIDPGFTALSGETGAGKSILIDALGLVLGGRSDALLVREGAERAEIVASFALTEDAAASKWLRDAALADTEAPAQCILRRVLQSEGRSRAFINGTSVPLTQLRELGDLLIDILGQNESQSLRRSDVQRELLDAHGEHPALLSAVANAAAAWQQIEDRIHRLRGAAARDPAELELLRHQVAELEALRLGPNELEEIGESHRRLANGGRLAQEGAEVETALYGGDHAIHDQLARCANLLQGLSAIDARFAEGESLVQAAQEQVREAADGVRRLLDRLDLDPQRLADIEARLAEIHELARKHRLRPEALPDRLEALRFELSESEAAGGELDTLLAQQGKALEAYRAAAGKLSAARRKAAQSYGKAVCRHLADLGMPNARLEVSLAPANRKRPSPLGEDEICFDFSANPGQSPRPLAKVASGGELSRIGLAVQVVAQAEDGAPTLIFDEVDAGVGGAVAESVGRLLALLGHSRQVLCVTHLGQVAAGAANHLRVRKAVRKGQTFTSVERLDQEDRVAELARMLGGQAITKASQDMARELLRAQSGS